MCLAVIEQCGAVKKTITYFQDNSKGGFYEIKSVDVIITVAETDSNKKPIVKESVKITKAVSVGTELVINGNLKNGSEGWFKPSFPKVLKDDTGKKTVNDIVQELSAKVGEKVTLRRFVRFQVGEGIEKTQVNLAEEVEATIAGN